MIVLDTHVWLWLCTGDSRLTPRLADLIAESPRPLLSVVSLWEASLLLSRGRLQAGSLGVEELLQCFAVRLVPLTKAVVLNAYALPFVHNDPADRFIATLAHLRGATLATVDENLTRLPWLATLG